MDGIAKLADAEIKTSLDKATTLATLFEEDDNLHPIQEQFRRFIKKLDDIPELEAIILTGGTDTLEIQIVLAQSFRDENFSKVVARTAKMLVDLIGPLSDTVNDIPPGHTVGFDPIGEVAIGRGGDYTNEVILVLTPEDLEGINCPVTIKLIYALCETAPTGHDSDRAPVNRFEVRLRKEDDQGESGKQK